MLFYRHLSVVNLYISLHDPFHPFVWTLWKNLQNNHHVTKSFVGKTAVLLVFFIAFVKLGLCKYF